MKPLPTLAAIAAVATAFLASPAHAALKVGAKAPDFKQEGATVIGVTAGKLDELAAFSKETEHCGGKFPVAADAGARVATKYDSLLMQKPGWSNRTSYVISPDGRIVHVYSEIKPTDHVKETLEAVKALKSPKPKA